MHAAFTSEKEKMGILTGTVEDLSFIIYDAYLLPVEGSETRVSAGEDADIYRTRITDILSHVFFFIIFFSLKMTKDVLDGFIHILDCILFFHVLMLKLKENNKF